MTQILPPALLRQHIGVVGKTGSGKTSTLKLLVEQAVAEGARVCILDPLKSDWWGLTSSADGRKPGLPFQILGGPHGHVPLHDGAGAAIGSLVAAGTLPLSIIDMADFKPGGLQRFFVAFAEALFRNMRGVVYLVIEEAHEFAPKERAGIGDENAAIHWAKKLATGSRSKGIRLMVGTQRIQALHNAVLGSCETLITHRLTLPADQKPVMDWLKANLDKKTAETVAGSLSSLKTGSGWICSGEGGVTRQAQFPRISTFDNSATPTDDAEALKVTMAPVDVAALRGIVGSAVAEAEANDPKKLKAEIAALQKLVKKAGSEVAPGLLEDAEAKGAEAGYAQGFTDGAAAGWAAAVARFGRIIAEEPAPVLKAPQSPIPARLEAAFASRPKITGVAAREKVPGFTSPTITRPATAQASKPQNSMPARTSGGGAELRILRVLAQRHPARLTEAQWATIAGMKRTGGTWSTYKSRLRSSGYIDQGSDRLFGVTDDGLMMVGDLAPAPQTTEEVLQMWFAAVGSGPAKLLSILVERYPAEVRRDDLANQAGMTASGGTFSTYLSRLSGNGLIERSSSGLRASDTLFIG